VIYVFGFTARREQEAGATLFAKNGFKSKILEYLRGDERGCSKP
jgi:hypothetical protein